MRIQIIDEYEFDTSSSEENLLLVSCRKTHVRSMKAFVEKLEETMDLGLAPSVSLPKEPTHTPIARLPQVTTHLHEFCGVTAKGSELVLVLKDDWDEHDYLFELGHRYYRYFWSTSA